MKNGLGPGESERSAAVAQADQQKCQSACLRPDTPVSLLQSVRAHTRVAVASCFEIPNEYGTAVGQEEAE
jgi:hypothetical protein